MKKTLEQKIKHNRGGCPCCPRTEDLLSTDTILYNGFGGYSLKKNGKHFWSGDMNAEWETFPTLESVEDSMVDDENAIWEVVLYTPLRGATWKRISKSVWKLIETNQGFA